MKKLGLLLRQFSIPLTVLLTMSLIAHLGFVWALEMTPLPTGIVFAEIPDRFAKLIVSASPEEPRFYDPNRYSKLVIASGEGRFGKRASDRDQIQTHGLLTVIGANSEGDLVRDILKGTSGIGGLGTRTSGAYVTGGDFAAEHYRLASSPSTFALDVDTASYTRYRHAVTVSGFVPRPATIRVEEWVNYFDYGYAPPEKHPIAVRTTLSAHPLDSQIGLMRVAVKAARPDATRSAHLTFLIDRSCSMDEPERLPLAKRAMELLLEELDPDDTVAIVAFDDEAQVVLPRVVAANRGLIIRAMNDIVIGGGTALSEGLALAFDVAQGSLGPDSFSRVILLSDGAGNVGETRYQEIVRSLRAPVEEGVTLTAIGLGMHGSRDLTLERLADEMNGNYHYVDGLKEAMRVFSGEANGTLEVVAKDVKIQVQFDDERVQSYRLIGYENRRLKKEQFTNDRADGGEVGAGHEVTAFYEVVLRDDSPGPLATVDVRYKRPKGERSVGRSWRVHRETQWPAFADRTQSFRFGAAVALIADHLAHKGPGSGVRFERLERIACRTTDQRAERAEFCDLLWRIGPEGEALASR